MFHLNLKIRFVTLVLLVSAASVSFATAVSHQVIYPDEQGQITQPTTEKDVSELLDKELSKEQYQAIQNYEELVKKLQSQGGVYQVELGEVLLGLGNTQQGLGLHERAIETFERALHIHRVNDGLYSLGQTNVLEQLIESQTALNDWEGLDKSYHNLYWLNKRHHGENSTELLGLIDRLGRWHLKAYEMLPGKESFSHIVNAEELFNKALTIIEANGNNYDLRLINALYGLSLTNYQIAVQVSTIEDFDDIRAGFRGTNQTRALLRARQARDDLINLSYIKGKEALNRVVEIHANNPILPIDTQAMALTHLGDWYMLFNKTNTASETYDRAYQLLRDDGIGQNQIDLLFGQPRSLPAIQLTAANEEKIVPDNPTTVLASFDVSPSGKARNIEILETDPVDSEKYKRRARKSIASTRFRPRYEDGKPVLTTGVNLRYVFTE